MQWCRLARPVHARSVHVAVCADRVRAVFIQCLLARPVGVCTGRVPVVLVQRQLARPVGVGKAGRVRMGISCAGPGAHVRIHGRAPALPAACVPPVADRHRPQVRRVTNTGEGIFSVEVEGTTGATV
eukprot:5605000-Prymnesium_polylepis.1